MRINRFLRVVLATVFGASVLVVIAQPASADPAWWNASYSHRGAIHIANGPEVLPSGYSVSFVFDHAGLVSGSESLANGNDVRVVYWNGSSWAELDRILQPTSTGLPSTWNSASTKIWFRTQASLAAGATANQSYYLYWGNAAAGSPPADGNNVFDLYDDFSAGSVDTSKWTIHQNANNHVDVSGGQLRMWSAAQEGNLYFGIETKTSFSAGIASESTFSALTLDQDYTDNTMWRLKHGVRSEGEANVGGFYKSEPVINTGNALDQDSSLPATTFSGQRIGSTLDASSNSTWRENGILKSAGSGSDVGASTIEFAVVTLSDNHPVDFRLDDLFVRKFVAVEPAVVLDINRSATVSGIVDPSLLFTVSSHSGSCNGVSQSSGSSSSTTTVSLGHVNPTVNAVAAQDLTVATNAGSGFTVYARYAAAMNDGNGHTIADLGSSNAAPGAFSSPGTAAFGYTTSDATLGTGTADRFTNPSARWAGLTTTGAEVSYGSLPIASDTACVAFQFGAASTTPAGTYAATVIYVAVPSF